jgi:hypothetical protein
MGTLGKKCSTRIALCSGVLFWTAAFSHPPWALDSTIPVNPGRGSQHAAHARQRLSQVPTPSQIAWERREMELFVHFSMCTFKGCERCQCKRSNSGATSNAFRVATLSVPRYRRLSNWVRARGEWALGNESPDMFQPRALNTSQVSLPRRGTSDPTWHVIGAVRLEQWVEVAASAHIHSLLLTAKHHDGSRPPLSARSLPLWSRTDSKSCFPVAAGSTCFRTRSRLTP